MRRNLFWLSDEQWARIEPHLPTDVRGKQRVDDRRVISGIVHVLKSGCRWKDCPPEYGPHTTVYNRFTRWARREPGGSLRRPPGDSQCGRNLALRLLEFSFVASVMALAAYSISKFSGGREVQFTVATASP